MVRGLRWLPQLGWLGAGFGAAVLCAAVLCAAMLLVGACSFSRETVSDSTVPASTPATTISTTTTTTASTTSTTEDPAGAVVAAFAGFIQALEESSNPYRSDHPMLAEHTTTSMAELITKAFSEFEALGHSSEGSFQYRVLGVQFENQRSAVLRVCALDGVAVLAADGGVVVPADEHAEIVRVEVVESGRWLVDSLATESEPPELCVL